MFRKKGGDYSFLSLDKSVRIFGRDVKRLPLGAYISAVQKISDAPNRVIQACFEGETLVEILDDLTRATDNELGKLFKAIFEKAPAAIVSIVAELTGFDERELLEDEKIGLGGVIDIVRAFVDVNGLKKKRL